MKNAIMVHDLREISEFIYQDYTSRNFKTILDMPELSDNDYIDYMIINTNQTLEQVSYNLYGIADYWDILFLINNRDPLFDMPYDFDILSSLATAKITKYKSNYSGIFAQSAMDILESKLLLKLEAESDSFRTLKVIKPAKLYDFIRKYRETNINV